MIMYFTDIKVGASSSKALDLMNEELRYDNMFFMNTDAWRMFYRP